MTNDSNEIREININIRFFEDHAFVSANARRRSSTSSFVYGDPYRIPLGYGDIPRDSLWLLIGDLADFVSDRGSQSRLVL